MTKSEINQKISQLKETIADAEERKLEAEKNIRQLSALNASCSDYQIEFESARTVRKFRLEDFDQITGQARLVGAYDGVLGDLLNGYDYIGAYGGMDTAKSEISREIEKQRQVICECDEQIAGFNSSIGYWQQELVRADKEARDALYRINYRR